MKKLIIVTILAVSIFGKFDWWKRGVPRIPARPENSKPTARPVPTFPNDCPPCPPSTWCNPPVPTAKP